MGGKVPPGMATASATVPAWLLAEIDKIAPREGYPSRSQYIAAVLLGAVEQDKARHPEVPTDGPAPGPEPTDGGDGP